MSPTQSMRLGSCNCRCGWVIFCGGIAGMAAMYKAARRPVQWHLGHRRNAHGPIVLAVALWLLC